MDDSEYRFHYNAMSNKVTQADRRFISRNREKDEPESLAGKISVKDIGSRSRRAELPKSGDASQTIVADSRRKTAKHNTSKSASLFESSENMEGIRYFPMTAEAREVFGLIMTWIAEQIGDVSHDTLLSAADAVITIIKDSNARDIEKKKEVEELIGPVSSEKLSQIIALCKQVPDPEADQQDPTEQRDQNYGVAVTFEDEAEEDERMESSDDEGSSISEYRSEHSSGSDGEVSDNELAATNLEDDEEADEEIKATTKSDTSHKSTLVASENVIPANEIDEFWLQNKLSAIFTDALTLQSKTKQVYELLASSMSLSQVENDIMEAFDFENFQLTKLLCINRDRIVWLTKLAKSDTDEERQTILADMARAGLQPLVHEVSGDHAADTVDVEMSTEEEVVKTENAKKSSELRLIDLDDLVFEQGSHLYTGGKLTLPKNTTQFTTKTYEEYDVPAPEAHIGTRDPLVPIAQLPEWARPAFGTAESLNTVQSKVYPCAFGTEENILLCAPTGAGKTNVALLTMLRTISQYRDAQTGKIDRNAFKMVYIAPLKALVQEQVREFSQRLAPFDITVAELTGDRNMTKDQIRETQLIITTPEKWDVITRKSADTSYTSLVRLMIVDEIHLLHDERGPVIESLVSRAIRKNETADESVRLVGLSATLPNYHDVASFLRVDDSGLFFFDSSYRPCPLAQKFIGITEKKAIKRYQAMNDACYDKVMDYAGKHQVIIFVHSRKETAKTARFLRDKALESGTLNLFLRNDANSQQILRSEAQEVQNADLKDLLPTGFAIHHAGLSRPDRASSEELFASGRVQVLVCTATLAWGVNLPAHTVIIKGTQVYNPEKGRWSELSPQDVLQMLGRAGRPRYDSSGEGIIITAHSELTYYMSLLCAKLPIESQLMSKLSDNLNAEIVLGTVNNRDEAVQWLSYTYLFVRMLRSPALYGINRSYYSANDKSLLQRRLDLSHSALTALEQSGLVKYDVNSGSVHPTELGRIASYFYISHNSMHTYNRLLKPFFGPVDVFRVFSLSEEFKLIPVRQEEKLELQKLMEMAPIPVKESVEEPAAKINILLQSYISRLKLEGFALMADMICVTQSAGRLVRALFEICLRKGWAELTRTLLDLCKMIERRMWLSNSPLRQFAACPSEVIKKTEASQMPWSRYFDLSDPAEVGQAIRVERAGKQVFQMLKEFPRVDLSVHFQPITPSLLRLEVDITPKFEWNRAIHGTSESFTLLVEDGDGERILYYDTFVLREKFSTAEHVVEFTVPLSDPLPPVYFVSLISDKWLHSETRVPIDLRALIVPAKFPAFTPVYDLEPIPTSELKVEDFVNFFPFKFFNRIQSQVFHPLYDSDNSIFIGSAPGNGVSTCIDIALLKHWKDEDSGKVVYLSPFQDVIDKKLTVWKQKFSHLFGGKAVAKLSGRGDISVDLKTLERSDLILATPSQWDVLSRRWQKRKYVRAVELLVADDIHLIGGYNGAIYETVLARMRYMAAQTETPLRIVALSVSLANGKDVGQWIGASSQTILNFSPQERVNAVDLHLQSFAIPHHPSMMIAMAKPAFQALKNLKDNETATIYVCDRQQCIDTGVDLLRIARGEGGNEYLFLPSAGNGDRDTLAEYTKRIRDEALAESTAYGVGYFYQGMHSTDRRIIEGLFLQKILRVLICVHDTCWSSPSGSNLVVILGTQIFDGQEHRYIDYPVSEILKMVGNCEGDDYYHGKCLVLTNSVKREYYKKFLTEALPVESHVHAYFHDALLAEVSTGVVGSPEDAVDWSTYTYFYRRLQLNPSYYGLTDKSPSGISEYLSDLVETTFADLVEAKLIEEDEEEMTVTPTNHALIASYHNVSFITMQSFVLSLSGKTKIRGLLEIVTSAAEFESCVPIRNHEDKILAQIYGRVPFKSADVDFQSPRFKTFILMQAHFSRLSLPAELETDQKVVLERILTMLSAAVDVLSVDAHLNAMYAMDLSQMTVQAMWDKDSPLKQIPYFNSELIQRCKDNGVESVYDFMSIEDDDVRTNILGMGDEDARISAIADFVNNYPNVDISHCEVDTSSSLIAGEEAVMSVSLQREMDEDTDFVVRSKFYPFTKTESWWLVVGSAESRQLYGIKRITITEPEKKVDLKFIVPTAGKHSLTVWCTCDSYADVDKEAHIEVDVQESNEQDEE